MAETSQLSNKGYFTPFRFFLFSKHSYYVFSFHRLAFKRNNIEIFLKKYYVVIFLQKYDMLLGILLHTLIRTHTLRNNTFYELYLLL